jgi:hypothetical protein
METTIHRSFIRGANLRRWMSRRDAHVLVKTAKSLFDKMYMKKADDHPMAAPIASDSDDDHSDDDHNAIAASSMPRIRLNGVTYSRSQTHVGNSGVMWRPEGGRRKLAVPGRIEKIERDKKGNVYFHVKQHCPAELPYSDPFEQWPELQAKIWSTKHMTSLRIPFECIVSQTIVCDIGDDLCVVMAIYRVFFYFSCYCHGLIHF